MRVLRWVSGAVWLWSWYTMYLEIFRWGHVTRRLRFNPGPPIPGTDIQPKPGLPLKVLFGCFFVAPIVLLATLIAGRHQGGGSPK